MRLIRKCHHHNDWCHHDTSHRQHIHHSCMHRRHYSYRALKPPGMQGRTPTVAAKRELPRHPARACDELRKLKPTLPQVAPGPVRELVPAFSARKYRRPHTRGAAGGGLVSLGSQRCTRLDYKKKPCPTCAVGISKAHVHAFTRQQWLGPTHPYIDKRTRCNMLRLPNALRHCHHCS